MCSYVGSVRRLQEQWSETYICFVAGIFILEHMAVPYGSTMKCMNISTPGNIVDSAHELICIIGGYVAFDEHPCCCHVYGNNMVSKSCISIFSGLCVHLCGAYMCTTVAKRRNIYVSCGENIGLLLIPVM